MSTKARGAEVGEIVEEAARACFHFVAEESVDEVLPAYRRIILNAVLAAHNSATVAKVDWESKHQALLTVHNVFCTAIRKAIGMECECPINDILENVIALAARHREAYSATAAKDSSLNETPPTSGLSGREGFEATSIRTYHPNPEINAEIIQQALEAEIFDPGAGYEPRWWTCPKCESSHHRGHFGTVGSHRCLHCGYVGPDGTMHINDPRLKMATQIPRSNDEGEAGGVSPKETTASAAALPQLPLESETLADWREQILAFEKRDLIADTPATRSFLNDVRNLTPPARDQSDVKGFEAKAASELYHSGWLCNLGAERGWIISRAAEVITKHYLNSLAVSSESVTAST